MWIFIASEMLFFGGLMLAYAWGRAYDPAGFAQASRHTHVLIGTVNTALLLSSSLLVALATLAAEIDATARARLCRGLLAGAALIGLLFLALKGVEYRMEWREHLVPGPGFFAEESEPPLRGAALFFAFYFIATGLHALHVAVGVVWLGVLGFAFHRRKRWADGTRTHIAGLYWHFVDAVWVLLYPLLYLVERHG